MPTFECSGRHLNGELDPWGCRKPAVGGFVAASGTEARQVWLFCGEEHTHPGIKPLEKLVWELLGRPRHVGEPLPEEAEATR